MQNQMWGGGKIISTLYEENKVKQMNYLNSIINVCLNLIKMYKQAEFKWGKDFNSQKKLE